MNLGRIVQATEQFQEIGGKNASGGKLYVFTEPSQTLRASTLYKVGNHEILPNPLFIDDRGQVEDFLVDAEYEYYLIVKDIEGEEIFTRHNVTCVDGGEGAMSNDYYEGDFIRIDEDRTINVSPLKRLAVETPLTLTESESELLIGIDTGSIGKDYTGANGIEVNGTVIDGSALQDKDKELEDRIGTYDELINDLTDKVEEAVQDVANKQDKLTPGTNIEITTGGTINCTIDTSQFATNDDLTNNYYTKTQVDNTFQVKGDYATKDEIPDVSGFITKTQADADYQPKGNYALVGDSYTKADSDSRYAAKGDIPDVSGFITKTTADATYQPKGDYATKSEIPDVSGFITKTTADATYQEKGNYQPAGDYPTRTEISTTYQEKLIAGEGIEIASDGKTISATGGGCECEGVQLIPGDGINMDTNDDGNIIISATANSAEWGNITGTLADQYDLSVALNQKQNALSPGDGINITDNVISVVDNKPVVPLIAGTNVTMSESDDGIVISSDSFKPYVWDGRTSKEVTSLTLQGETNTNNPKLVYNTESSSNNSIDLVPSFNSADAGKILSVTQRGPSITLEWAENNGNFGFVEPNVTTSAQVKAMLDAGKHVLLVSSTNNSIVGRFKYENEFAYYFDTFAYSQPMRITAWTLNKTTDTWSYNTYYPTDITNVQSDCFYRENNQRTSTWDQRRFSTGNILSWHPVDSSLSTFRWKTRYGDEDLPSGTTEYSLVSEVNRNMTMRYSFSGNCILGIPSDCTPTSGVIRARLSLDRCYKLVGGSEYRYEDCWWAPNKMVVFTDFKTDTTMYTLGKTSNRVYLDYEIDVPRHKCVSNSYEDSYLCLKLTLIDNPFKDNDIVDLGEYMCRKDLSRWYY